MRIKLLQLKTIIKEEIIRLIESNDPDAALSVLENEDLVNIADNIRDMERKKVPPSAIIKFLDGAIVADVKSAIQYALEKASPTQLKELEYEAVFGDVNSLSGEYEKSLVKDPLETLNVAKSRLAKKQALQDLGIIALQLRGVDDILEQLLKGEADGAEEGYDVHDIPSKKKGIFNFFSR